MWHFDVELIVIIIIPSPFPTTPLQASWLRVWFKRMLGSKNKWTDGRKLINFIMNCSLFPSAEFESVSWAWVGRVRCLIKIAGLIYSYSRSRHENMFLHVSEWFKRLEKTHKIHHCSKLPPPTLYLNHNFLTDQHPTYEDWKRREMNNLIKFNRGFWGKTFFSYNFFD